MTEVSYLQRSPDNTQFSSKQSNLTSKLKLHNVFFPIRMEEQRSPLLVRLLNPCDEL